MHKSIISVVGQDRPGIVADVAAILAELECNIEDVSQTILQGQFAALFIASIPGAQSVNEVRTSLEDRLAPQGLNCVVREFEESAAPSPREAASFVIITIGPDAPGLIAAMAGVLKTHAVNICNLQAVNRSQAYPDQMVMIYEVTVPEDTSLPALRTALQERAARDGLEVSVQHKAIFEEIHRL